MQRSKFNLEVQTCPCFSKYKIQFHLEQVLNTPALALPNKKDLLFLAACLNRKTIYKLSMSYILNIYFAVDYFAKGISFTCSAFFV
jgi:hypothetical protein